MHALHTYMCIHVCMYVCMYVCMHVSMHARYAYICIHLWLLLLCYWNLYCMYMHVCKCMYEWVCIHVCSCVCVWMRVHMYLNKLTSCMYCDSHNNWGPQNSFQRFVVPVYYWKTVEKPETDPQLLWEWHYVWRMRKEKYSLSSMHTYTFNICTQTFGMHQHIFVRTYVYTHIYAGTLTNSPKSFEL
jgi:hypothetical protein